MDDIDITVAGLREDVQCLLHDLERKDAEIEQLKRQLQESRADHTALQRALIGDTGASAILEAERLSAGITQICDGLERGDIGDDVVWFDNFQTLWEFCAALIGREEPLGDGLREPTGADMKYLIQRLQKLVSKSAAREAGREGMEKRA